MENVKELHGRLFVLNSFFRSYSCFIALEHKCQELDREFGGLCPFTHIHNILLSDAVTSWCKLFGSWKDEGHWKKLIPKEDHNKFLVFMQNETKLTLDEFNNYRKEMVLFRNKWVVHHDVNFKQNPVPFFDTAHSSALALNVYIRENSDDKIIYDGPECMSDFGEQVAQAMLSKIVAPKT
ncbi:hypothetical protein [Psychromonas hadalis]|uniref:hypothetical protein n=1 Tax=Psychromonas hadalis TaxID=211669 RepID=UPI0003B5F2EA|nr:hypothetical protein [Psychromonas hadalis]